MERVDSPVPVGRGLSDHGRELSRMRHGSAPRRLGRRQRCPTARGTFRGTAQHNALAIESERAGRHPVATASRLAATPCTNSAPTPRRGPGSASCGRTRACRQWWSMRTCIRRSHRCTHGARSAVGGRTHPFLPAADRARLRLAVFWPQLPIAVRESADLVHESGPLVAPTAPISDSRGSPNGKLPRRPDS